MRLLTFVALYAGLLVASTITFPVPSEYEWAPDTTADLSRFPRCLEIASEPGTGWVRIQGLVELQKERGMPGLYRTKSRLRGIDWTPSRADSFDLGGHHTLILRFPVTDQDTLVGRAYPPSYYSIYDALLVRPMTVTDVSTECPRSGVATKDRM